MFTNPILLKITNTTCEYIRDFTLFETELNGDLKIRTDVIVSGFCYKSKELYSYNDVFAKLFEFNISEVQIRTIVGSTMASFQTLRYGTKSDETFLPYLTINNWTSKFIIEKKLVSDSKLIFDIYQQNDLEILFITEKKYPEKITNVPIGIYR